MKLGDDEVLCLFATNAKKHVFSLPLSLSLGFPKDPFFVCDCYTPNTSSFFILLKSSLKSSKI